MKISMEDVWVIVEDSWRGHNHYSYNMYTSKEEAEEEAACINNLAHHKTEPVVVVAMDDYLYMRENIARERN